MLFGSQKSINFSFLYVVRTGAVIPLSVPSLPLMTNPLLFFLSVKEFYFSSLQLYKGQVLCKLPFISRKGECR
jgi:hypothetical protein